MLTASSQLLLFFRLLKGCLPMQLSCKCHAANAPHTLEFSKGHKNTYTAVFCIWDSLMHKLWRRKREHVCILIWCDETLSSDATLTQLVMTKSVYYRLSISPSDKSRKQETGKQGKYYPCCEILSHFHMHWSASISPLDLIDSTNTAAYTRNQPFLPRAKRSTCL